MRNHYVNVHLYGVQCVALQIFACVALTLVLLFSSGVTAENSRSTKRYNLNIQKQERSSALIKLGSELGLSIIIPEDASPVGESGIVGTYSAGEALNALLSDTPFTFRQLGPRTFLIQARPEQVVEAPVLEEVNTQGYQTGSHIFRSLNSFNGPLDQISSLEIERAGSQSLSDLIKFIPAVSGNSTSTSISNGGDGTTKVTLRGLPANNTLVLLNGQRVSFDGLAGDSVDLNAIPPQIIKRIDIYKDGASAIYGSEAIAGVINIITRTRFDGLRLSQYAGQSDDGHAQTFSSDALWGATGKRFTALVALSYFTQEGIFGGDRALTASADGRSRGGLDRRSSATENSRILLGNQAYILRDNVAITTPAVEDFRLASNEDLYDFNPQKSILSPSSRLSAYSFLTADIADTLRWHGQFIFSSTEATITLAPTPLSTSSANSGTFVVSRENIYNPFGVDIRDIRRRVVELPPRTQRNFADSLHVNSGLTIESELITWKINAYWNKVEAEELSANLVDGDRVAQALGPEQSCRGIAIDGCEPLNLFGPAGSISQAQLDYIAVQNKEIGQSVLMGLNLDLSGSSVDRRGFQFSYAGGVELRSESSQLDLAEGSRNALGSALDSDTEGERSVYEAYAEVLLPVKPAPGWGHLLEIELAARLANSSDYGTNLSPKLGLNYAINSTFSLRATYSQGYRAPSINELYRDGSVSFVNLEDPCSAEDSVGKFDGCQQQSDDTLRQFLTVSSGDRNLEPEVSNNYTVGISFSPQGMPGVNLSMDFFNIRLRNTINSDPQTLLNENAERNLFSDLIQRDENGNITRIDAPFINIGRRHVRGVDINLLYSNKKRFRWRINASHLIEFEQQLNQLTESEDLAGTFRDAAREGNGSLPKWKVNTGFTWFRDSFEINYSLNYIGATRETFERERVVEHRRIGEWITHNIQWQKQIFSYDLAMGVDNMFNRRPPFSATAFNSNFDAHAYDIKGRFVYFKIGKQF